MTAKPGKEARWQPFSAIFCHLVPFQPIGPGHTPATAAKGVKVSTLLTEYHQGSGCGGWPMGLVVAMGMNLFYWRGTRRKKRAMLSASSCTEYATHSRRFPSPLSRVISYSRKREEEVVVLQFPLCHAANNGIPEFPGFFFTNVLLLVQDIGSGHPIPAQS